MQLTAPGQPAPMPLVSSRHATVRDALRRDILHGRLPGGTRLHQTQLAGHYGVSITPIREALRDLSSEGLVDFTAYSGAVVHQATIAELEQIYRMRAALIPLAVEEAIPRITEAELEQAERLLSAMEAASSRDDWIEDNRQLHHVLDGATRNPLLTDVLRRLADLSTMYVNISITPDPVRRPGADTEHRALLNAFRARDVERATHLSLDHFRHTLELTRAQFSAPPLAT